MSSYSGAFIIPGVIHSQFPWYDLDEDMPWDHQTPARAECWMAPHTETYTYGEGRGQRTYQSNRMPWPVWDAMIRLNDRLGTQLNCCMANRYGNRDLHLGWHADDSPEMDHAQPIVTVSLGAHRYIFFRPIGATGEATQKLLMPHGSACVMPPGMQREWHHKIPKHSAPCGLRIGLTFRRYDAQ